MSHILLRVNLDISDRKFDSTLRFAVAADSIASVARGGNKVIVLAHRGRPRGADMSLSLRKFAPALSRKIKKQVVFIPYKKFATAKDIIKSSPNESVFLMENMRFFPGESSTDKSFAKKLADLGDRYINDDFATSHRKSASITEIAKLLPSTAGTALKMEIKELNAMKRNAKKPFVIIIGGVKIEDKIPLIKNFIEKADAILLGGGAANTVLKQRGVNIGRSLYSTEAGKPAKILANSEKVITPPDWRTENGKILDIGPETEKLYSALIKGARTIIWNGPMGYIERQKFSGGTEKIERAVMANKNARTVIGGGETVSALNTRIVKQKKGNVFISTGGGAMLEFLADKKMPALDALGIEYKRQ